MTATKIAVIIRVSLWALVASAALFLLVSKADAQAVCTERSKIVASLGATYFEAPVALGLAGNGGVIEVFATVDGETFTLIITRPNGVSCIMATGEAWVNIPFVLKKGLSDGKTL